LNIYNVITFSNPSHYLVHICHLRNNDEALELSSQAFVNAQLKYQDTLPLLVEFEFDWPHLVLKATNFALVIARNLAHVIIRTITDNQAMKTRNLL